MEGRVRTRAFQPVAQGRQFHDSSGLSKARNGPGLQGPGQVRERGWDLQRWREPEPPEKGAKGGGAEG